MSTLSRLVGYGLLWPVHRLLCEIGSYGWKHSHKWINRKLVLPLAWFGAYLVNGCDWNKVEGHQSKGKRNV